MILIGYCDSYIKSKAVCSVFANILHGSEVIGKIKVENVFEHLNILLWRTSVLIVITAESLKLLQQ